MIDSGANDHVGSSKAFPGLEVQPIEAGHVGLEGGCTPKWSHFMSPKGLKLFAASDFQPLGKHGDCGDPVFTTQRLCSRSALLSE